MKKQKPPREIELRTRISEEERDAIQSRAEASGLTASAWTRMTLRRALGLAPLN